MDVEAVTMAERPELAGSLGVSWPRFIFHDPVASRLMPEVDRLFAAYNIVLLDAAKTVVAGAWGVPIRWDGTVEGLPGGWDGALERAVSGRAAGVPADTMCAMASEVVVEHRRKGLAGSALRALRDRAGADGLDRMIAPARPTLKHRYPLIPIGEYASWTRADGSPFDPWLRTHRRLGARVLAPEPNAMRIVGSVSDWEEWTGVELPASGEFVVPEALTPIAVDRERDQVRYIEPAVWMLHVGT